MLNFFIDGIQHITDIEGYDHMLFLLALCAPFTFKQWKPVVLLATAFTLGHSISLVLASLDLVRFSSDIIEFLIPITIIITAAFNLIAEKNASALHLYRYATTAAFGIIHGMGFSSFFRIISSEGESFIAQLFFFNLGVEAGQLLIVAAILSCVALITLMIPSARMKIGKVLSTVSLLLALFLAIEKWPF
jgi:hypothetical protein